MIMEQRKLMTRAEVADALGVSPGSITKAATTGALTAIRLGHRTVRFRPEDVDAFLASQIQTTTPLTGEKERR